MSSWVLPEILSVDEIITLDENVLELFTQISTGIIVHKVNKFVEDNINSSVDANRLAAEKLQKAYSNINRINEYLNSDDARDLADLLASLQYVDISASVELSKLHLYRNSIIELLSEDKDFVESYTHEIKKDETYGMKTAYTKKLDKDNLDRVLAEMDKYVNSSDSGLLVATLIKRIKKFSSLFKNGNLNVNDPTVLRKAIFKKDKLRNILKGLDYLIPKLEAGQSPATWRRL